jgi:hypothetical protein
VDVYPLYAASALAANAFVRCSFAGESDPVVPTPLSAQLGFSVGHKDANFEFHHVAAFPLFGIQMYEKLGFQWAGTLLAFLTLVMMPFPYIFFRYGKKIRGKSRFATD